MNVVTQTLKHMKLWSRIALGGFGLWLMTAVSLPAATLHFAGCEWTVKTGKFGPGPNYWDDKNVWVDADGYLHLNITQRDGKWYCSELNTTNRLGFGRYQFQVIGRLDKFDPNIVLGLFNYPTRDVGVDGTNEIDLEFAHWGRPDSNVGNYTVWPPTKNVKHGSKTYPIVLTGDYTTHRFTWSSTKLTFQSLHGHRDDDESTFAEWTYAPENPTAYIPQEPLRYHLNLWLFHGQPPRDGKPVEIIIRSMKFTPENAK